LLEIDLTNRRRGSVVAVGRRPFEVR
jgi:hypothetical protein